MSISILKNYPLDKLNTFNISANAKFFYEFKTLESLKEILNHKLLKTEKSFVLGGGSNILISNDFETTPPQIVSKLPHFLFIGASDLIHIGTLVKYTRSNF